MILEQRWTTVEPAQYLAEERLVGDPDRFAAVEREAGVAVVRPAAGTAAELLELLESERADHPQEPLWSGVRDMTADNGAVRIEFVERVVPRLLPVVGSAVEVACHLYHSPDEQKADHSSVA
jgi:peptide/nickel transport system ATP-binding protein